MRNLARTFVGDLLQEFTGDEKKNEPGSINSPPPATFLPTRKNPKLINIEFRRYVPSGSFKPVHKYMQAKGIPSNNPTVGSMDPQSEQTETVTYPEVHKTPFKKPKVKSVPEPPSYSITEDVEAGTVSDEPRTRIFTRLRGGGRGAFGYYGGPFYSLAQCMYCILVLSLIMMLMSGTTFLIPMARAMAVMLVWVFFGSGFGLLACFCCLFCMTLDSVPMDDLATRKRISYRRRDDSRTAYDFFPPSVRTKDPKEVPGFGSIHNKNSISSNNP